MKFRLRFVLPMVALVLSAAASRAQTVELPQQWAAGKKYFLTARTVYQSKVKLDGETSEDGMEMTAEMSVAVTAHEDGTRKKMVLRYERIATVINSNGRKMGFDSARPKAKPDTLGLKKSIGAMVGKNLKLVADARGEITEVENFDELFRQLKSSELSEQEIRKMFDKESLNQAIRQGALQALPEKAVDPGDVWPFAKDVNLPQLGKGTVQGTYTYKQLSKRGGAPCAEIVMSGVVKSGPAVGPKDTEDSPAPSQVKISDGTTDGTLWFDPKLGVARESQITQKMTISMKSPVDDSTTIDVPVKQTFTTNLTKVENLK